MKILSSITGAALALLLMGCATEKRVTTLEGRGTKQMYTATYDQTWRATVDAAQRGNLQIMTADRYSGYIATRRGLPGSTLGENIGIWVREVSPLQTEVEVVSRQPDTPVAWLRKGENDIQRDVAVNLTREVPAVGRAPRETIIERGDGSSTIIIPESRRGETIIIPESSAARETVAEQRRQIEELRIRREAGQRALAAEVDETKREMLQRQMDRLREDLRVQEERLRSLERELK